MRCETGVVNLLGNRQRNEDRCALVQRDDAYLLVVADGMGGHKGGHLASQQTVDTISKHYREQSVPLSDPISFLQHAVLAAHDDINALGLKQQPPIYPRTTCVACIVQEGCAWWISVGDSRVYLMREGKVNQRTRDHTYIEQLVELDVIEESDRSSHPLRNYITHCLGGPKNHPPVEVNGPIPLEKDDIILLCSDGLWGAVELPEDLPDMDTLDLDSALGQLAEHAESSSYPYSDNISAVALRVLTQPSYRAATQAPQPASQPIPSEDSLSRAIHSIEEAIINYRKEMDD